MKKKSEDSTNRKLDDEIVVKGIESKTTLDTSQQKAENEKKDWTDEESISQRAIKQQKDSNTLRELWVMGWIVPALMFFLCGLFIIFLGSWSWHFFMPDDRHWLSPIQIDKIESTIFSSALGAIASFYFQNKINKNSTSSDTTSRFG